MIQPTRKIITKAERQFTDREPFLQAFYNALENKTHDEYKVLVYYGVAASGKPVYKMSLKHI